MELGLDSMDLMRVGVAKLRDSAKVVAAIKVDWAGNSVSSTVT